MGSLSGAPLTRYRFEHWLCDVLKNFFSDPMNIKDERLCMLLSIQDGIASDECRSLFQIDLPYSKDTRKACTTPAILISAGESKYPLRTVGALGAPVSSLIGYRAARSHATYRTIAGNIAVATESLDGTVLLCDAIEEFLLVNNTALTMDNMVSQLNVIGSSAPQGISAGEAANAKDIVQSIISVEAVGGIAWETDVQGPTYRGLTQKVDKT